MHYGEPLRERGQPRLTLSLMRWRNFAGVPLDQSFLSCKKELDSIRLCGRQDLHEKQNRAFHQVGRSPMKARPQIRRAAQQKTELPREERAHLLADGPLLFVLSEGSVFPLLVVRSIKERHDLAAGAVVVGAEQAAADALGHAVSRRPGDRVRKVAVGQDVGELSAALAALAFRARANVTACARVQVASGEKRAGRRAGRRAGGDAVSMAHATAFS